MKLFLKSSFFLLGLLFLCFLSAHHALARICPDGDPANCFYGDPTYTYIASYCEVGTCSPNWSGSPICSIRDPGVCPDAFCGHPNNTCCSGGAAWTQYTTKCVTIQVKTTLKYICQNINQVAGAVCNDSDQCPNRNSPILHPGSCTCGQQPNWGYKTCCYPNGSTANCQQYCGAPGTFCPPIYQGSCPGGSVIIQCNDPSRNNNPGKPTCGQPACDTLAPPETISGKVSNSIGGAGISGVSVSIHDISRNTTAVVTTNASGNFSNGNTVHRNDSYYVRPATYNGSAGPSGFIVGKTWAPNSPNPWSYENQKSQGNPNCGTNCNFSFTPGDVMGTVFIDLNGNGKKDAGEQPFLEQALVQSAGPSNLNTYSSPYDGTYDLRGLSQGNYTFGVTVNGWLSTTGNVVKTVGPNTTIDFGIIPLQDISGNVYNDVNKDGYYTAGVDSQFSLGEVVITDSNNKIVATPTITNGAWTTGRILPLGTYTVAYTAPLGYQMTYPKPPSLIISVGLLNGVNSCNVNGAHEASCDASGNANNVDFFVNDETPWIQGYCADMRNDNGFVSAIPQAAACGCPDGAVASCKSPLPVCTSPGIIFSGNTTPDYGYFSGQANTKNWQVGNGTYGESYQTPNPGDYRTSYDHLLTTAKQSGITPVNMTTICDPNNCDLSTPLTGGTLDHGVYNMDGNLTMSASDFTFPAGQNYVILVNGNLTIQGKILLGLGSTVTFSASGNINVDGAVGETVTSSLSPDLEGFYSTDKSMILETAANPPGTCNPDGSSNDKRLNIVGSVVVGANGDTTGRFQNQRDLCSADLTCSTVTITTDPLQILNAPSFIKHQNYVWTEVNP